jgi:hypothetical protein
MEIHEKYSEDLKTLFHPKHIAFIGASFDDVFTSF